MQYRRTLTSVALAGVITLAGCGGNDVADRDAHNDADIEFAQQMIPHHRQALEMAQLAETRAADPEVEDLAAAIEAAQDPEIQTMTGWLESWGEDVPAEMPMGEGGEMAPDMAGMMSDEEMARLRGATGAKFDQIFLAMMVEHHEGAIEMARTEQTEGRYPPALDVAADIESGQTAEIATMRQLLAR